MTSNSRFIPTGSAAEAYAQVEVALNLLRLTYLQAIGRSGALRNTPAQAASHQCNEAFVVLCGIEGDRSQVAGSQQVEAYLSSIGFDPRLRNLLDWERGKDALNRGLQALRRMPEAPARILAELYSIKPGFHEVWLHDDYPDDVRENPDHPVGRILGVIRGRQSQVLHPSHAEFERLTDLGFFLRHAACALTEGPMVRRRPGVDSYFDILQGIGPERSVSIRRRRIEEGFHVLDTWQHLQDHNSETGLWDLIDTASAFVRSGPLPRPETQANASVER